MTDILRAAHPLRIGYVLKRFPRLSETFILNELLELERQGVEIEIFSLMRPPAEARHAMLGELKAPVTYLPGSSSLETWTIKKGYERPRRQTVLSALNSTGSAFGDLFSGKTPEDISKLHLQAASVALLAKGKNIQHLHAHFASDATTVALLGARLAALPFSFTAHARDIYHTYVNPIADNAMRRAKIAEASFVITVSDYNQRHLAKLSGNRDPHKIHRLYNGIDLDRFHPVEKPRNKRLILSVGRLIEKKGFPDLIAACHLLHQRNLDFQCLIVGDGPDREILLAQTRELGIGQKIEFTGSLRQEDLVSLLSEATMMVLPCVVSESGDRDGLPTVLLEALAAGLPTVTTRVSGGPEIVEDCENGFLLPPNDPVNLAGAMARLLDDPVLAKSMGAKGRAKAERLFDLKHNVAELHAHFEASANGHQQTMEAAE